MTRRTYCCFRWIPYSVFLGLVFAACSPPPTLRAPTDPELGGEGEALRATVEAAAGSEASEEVLDNVSVLVETPATADETDLPDISDVLAAETEAQVPSMEELFDYPVVINRRVLTWIDLYTGKSKRSFEHSLRRSGRFLPMAREIFADEGVPQDLAFLAHIESGFRSNARSSKRALGLWQFMRGTAKDCGLRCDSYVDERMNPERATRAAARYLKQLHHRYDDWLLALAAYNAGPGNVDKAIRAAGSKNFWEIAQAGRLVTETQNFVPAILAATILAKSPGAYGLTEEVDPPFAAEVVMIESPTRLATIAQITGLTVEELRNDYNPDLLQDTTPPTRSGFALRLPIGYGTPTGRALAKLPPGERLLYTLHTVIAGETLGHVALRYGTTVRQLQMTNRLGRSSALKIGQELEIPSFGSAEIRQDLAPEFPGSIGGTHEVVSGESLHKIARYYGASVDEIQQANNIADPRRIYPGQTLRIPGTAEVAANLELKSLPTIVPDPVQEPTVEDTAAEMGRVESTAHLVDQFRDEIEGRSQPTPASLSAASGESADRSAAGSSASAETKFVLPEVHLVQSGETLSEIGSRYRISVPELREWNGLGRSSLIKPGQRIALNAGAGVGSNGSAGKGEPSFHTVAKGETLWRIARNYGIKVADLVLWNRLRSRSRIYPGQQLKIF